jgi:phenylacetate-CoA ligase
MTDLPADAARRFPGLALAAYARLRWLAEHPHAPRFNHQGVDRLTAEGAARVQAFEAALSAAPRGWRAGAAPGWLAEHAAFCLREVPAYRAYGPPPPAFADIPTCDRADLSRAPWDFVPDTQPIDGLTFFQTSGLTGHPLDVITHPESLAHYYPLLRAALRAHGVSLDPPFTDPGVAVVVVCHQASTYTYAAVARYLDDAGLVKVNLNPADWRDPDDRVRFIDACQPRVITGDPVSLAALADLPLTVRPSALVSTAMTLLPGLRAALAERFGCPVVDVYSMNEAGPIAVLAPEGEAWALLSHRLYVEVLDAEGAACPPGVRGEITLTGGFNPFLPLLRYRTGDFARLDLEDPRQARLHDLEGRAPVVFAAEDGRPVNNIDVTQALKPFALAQFALRQAAGGALTLRVRGAADEAALRTALAGVFGPGLRLVIGPLDETAGKVVQYEREAP